MKNILKSLILAGFLAILATTASQAKAATPILSATSQGSSVAINISNANPFSPVNLYSRQSSTLWTVVNNIGRTDGSGYLNQSINITNDGSNSPIQMYVLVGGLQSPTVSVYQNGGGYNGNYGSGGYGCSYYGTCGGCTYSYNCGTGSGTLSLNQTTVYLTVGQTASITATNNYYGTLYVSSNSNSNIASTIVNSGSAISVYGQSAGNDTLLICSNGSSSCATVYVYVTGSNSGCSYYGCTNNNTISLSPSTLNLTSPQTASVSIVGGNYGSGYYISSNSNSYVATASVSGNTLYVSSLVGGSTSIIVCQNNYSSQCATLYVTVNGSGNGGCTYNCGSYGTITFSPSSVNINLGQSSTVNIYNSYYSGSTFYISSNSNSQVASASISGSSVYLLAGSIGSTTITVCQNGISSCGTLYVTVTSSGNTGNTLSLSQTTVTLNAGQTSIITAYGGNGIYVSSNSNSGVASYNISGNQLNINAIAAGSTTLNVCSNYGYGCANVYVTVNGTSCTYYGCGSGTGISLSQSSISLALGQSSAVNIYGNGSYYISSNSNSYVANALLSGNIVNVSANQSGTTSIYICQNGGVSQCATLYVTVNGNGGYNGTTNVILNPSTLNLSVGQTGTVNASGNGGYGYYISTNSNPGTVSATFNGSVLTVYGIANGSSTLQICQNGASACASVYVAVGNGSSVLGASTYANGQLISEGQAVYIVYKNTKTAFASSYAFTGLGFSFNNVVQVGTSGLVNSGYIVSTPYASHPWGSWIKSGNTIYFIHETGLIPVPDWNTFLNNGGQANLIVQANAYDLRLPILYNMTYSDSRLR